MLKTLPNMSEARSIHACSSLRKNGRDYIVVMGGWSSIKYGYVSSIEFYDLTLQPTSWVSVSGISLPTAMGRMHGSVVMKMDDYLCDVMLISNTTGKLHQCSGNYQWTEYEIPLTKGLKKMAVIDANLF